MPLTNSFSKARFKTVALAAVTSLAAVTCFTFTASARAASDLALMPWPAEVRTSAGEGLTVSGRFRASIEGIDDARLKAGVRRALDRLSRRSGGKLHGEIANDKAQLRIECAAAGSAVPKLGDDESYSLVITHEAATLRAPNVVGILRGLETLLQAARVDGDRLVLPALEINDHPRFAWRGLMIDVSRHWHPMPVIQRNLDAMAAVKLNVLHLHLTDDQGFRIESKTHPELHRLGSDGHFFTQAEMRELIAYAQQRGIRVVPEFDMPGHTTSWVVSHPELASLPGPYHIERRWGVFDPVLDPTNPDVYRLLQDFLGEMAALFPDEFLHIGGDENNGVQWNASPHIRAYLHEHNLKDNESLHAQFNRRVFEILLQNHRRLIGWDEILNPDLPQDSVIHSWRGRAGLAEAVTHGFSAVLSNGYYIDLSHPAADHYLNDPVPADTPLSAEQQKRVLGGEATMWSEWTTSENIDSRIWPRTAAIAERLWSPREVRDVRDMYRRLEAIDPLLAEAGSRHKAWPELKGMDRRFADAWRTVSTAVEPVKDYRRGEFQPEHTQLTPLDDLADWASPESVEARHFNQITGDWLGAPGALVTASPQALRKQLQQWEEAADTVLKTPEDEAKHTVFRLSVARTLRELSRNGIEALDAIAQNKRISAERAEQLAQTLKLAGSTGPAAVEFPFLKSLQAITAVAADFDARGSSPADWWRSQTASKKP